MITDASTGTDKIVGGFGAILTQVDEKGNYHVIAYGSRQLRDHELNYSPYLAEMAAANLGMEYFGNNLRGKQFIFCAEVIQRLLASNVEEIDENFVDNFLKRLT